MSFLGKEKCTMYGQFFHDELAGARGPELPLFSTFCLHIIYFQYNFFIISSLFPSLVVFVSIYPYNLMVTASGIYWLYIPVLSI